tara:strand:- start:1694 stop:1996 length:303 start_codon:yes stop_codon:yes gene_type:complete
MKRYYIKDDLNKQVVFKQTVPEVVSYLETICQRIHRQSRKNYMDEMVSLGHGYDDNQGAYFTELMAKTVDIGIVTKDGRLKRCNIHEHARNQKFKTEMGD